MLATSCSNVNIRLSRVKSKRYREVILYCRFMRIFWKSRDGFILALPQTQCGWSCGFNLYKHLFGDCGLREATVFHKKEKPHRIFWDFVIFFSLSLCKFSTPFNFCNLAWDLPFACLSLL